MGPTKQIHPSPKIGPNDAFEHHHTALHQINLFFHPIISGVWVDFCHCWVRNHHQQFGPSVAVGAVVLLTNYPPPAPSIPDHWSQPTPKAFNGFFSPHLLGGIGGHILAFCPFFSSPRLVDEEEEEEDDEEHHPSMNEVNE
ncbi:hypothetical protein niasHT_011290 [Heterodera trifolii]|uniref:Uncharacterized protein n=1 Tax=Heterodera trifolii TaxID=157864 RepID=A0ABD2L9U6_9BILA